MRHSLTSIAASLLLGTSACVGSMNAPMTGGGGDDDGQPQPQTARELFDSLQPQLQAECSSCHMGSDIDNTQGVKNGPDWMGATADQSYDTIMGYTSLVGGGPIIGDSPANSKLYFYGKHTGPAMSDALHTAVGDWIVQQAMEDGNTPDPNPDPPPPTGPYKPASLSEALQIFSDCMRYDDFVNTNFQNVANQNTTEGECYGCHAAGTGGSYLNQDDLTFYMGQRQMPYLLKLVGGTVNDDGSFADLVPARRYEMKRDDNNHPNYIMSDTRLQSIQDFFNDSYLRYQTTLTTVPYTPCTPDDPAAGQ